MPRRLPRRCGRSVGKELRERRESGRITVDGGREEKSSLFALCGARWVDCVFCGLRQDAAVVFSSTSHGEHGKKNALTGREKEGGEKIRFDAGGGEGDGFVATCVVGKEFGEDKLYSPEIFASTIVVVQLKVPMSALVLVVVPAGRKRWRLFVTRVDFGEICFVRRGRVCGTGHFVPGREIELVEDRELHLIKIVAPMKKSGLDGPAL